MHYNTKQFPALTFCGPHSKPHGSWGLSKNYNLRFYPELGNGVCEIHHIPCACVACTIMLEKPWISVIPLKKKNSINLSQISPIG